MMLVTAPLFATALAVLLWPASRAEFRLGELKRSVSLGLTGGGGRRTWWIGFALPAALFVVLGWSAAVVSAMVGALVLRAVRRRRAERAADAHTADLLTALSVMIAELEVGAPPPRACAVAAEEVRRRRGADAEIARGLAAMAGRAELGGRVWASEPAASSSVMSWERIGVAWQTSDSYGLPMVELMRSLRSDVLSRRQFHDRTRAGMAGPRATATVLAGLPILGIALGQGIGAHPLTVLFSPGLGGILFVVGTGLAAAGLLWSQRITDKVLTG